ncbi:hypothetical protein [Cereibacter sphaeroides]|uniref:hypothetical protein n=1 Tax=Cereibacter sphaeroides TaxID=1063 RepID=UPI0024953463|nr:hypothetical protein [Cereibacter sphaeroides]
MVFQKEIHHLTATSWGSAKKPNCNGDQARRDRDDRLGQSRSLGSLRRHDDGATVPASKDVTKYMRDPVRCHGRRGGGRPVT